ncbi:MAG: SRPBCC family protein [Saprospiraceae bacterium]
MNSLLAICLATVYGLVLRYLYVFLGSFMEVISISLVAATPLVIGYLTVALSGFKKVPNGVIAFFRPWAVTGILLILTTLLALEGVICWVIIYPFFSIVAGIGGLIAYHVLRYQQKQRTENPDILDDFDNPNTLKMSPLLLLPVLLGLIENDRFLSSATFEITREIDIQAPVDRVWAAIATVDTVDKDDDHSFFVKSLGLPRHLRTELDTLAVGGRRTAYYERGLYFEETVTACIPGRLLRLRIKSDPGSIPPNVLDDHVAVGGKHFKAIEDTYRLEPLPGNRCRVQLTGRVVINTPFNWYARLWAHWLLSDTFDNVLGNAQKRATAP